MASMYAQYLAERTKDEILETDVGFVTYRFLNEGGSVYIMDIFVKPECRLKGAAAEMADIVAEIAKERGATEMLGSVNPSAKHSTESLKVLVAYGMTLSGATNDIIFFRKDI